MTARWRSLLRMRAVLRLLLEEHVALGTLSRIVASVTLRTDDDLVDENRTPSMTAALARDILHELLGDDVELIDRDVPLPNQELIDWIVKQRPIARRGEPRDGEPRDRLQVVIDEVVRRRGERGAAPVAGCFDRAVADELDELLSFLAGFTGGMGPTTDLARLEAWLGGREFCDLMQAYRHHPRPDLAGTATAFEAVKAGIRKAARA